MRTLIVDDDAIFRTELAQLLADEGHSALAVGSATEALSALETRWFDVLLTDLRMPHRSGMSLLDETALRWPGLRSVVFTGQPSDEAIAVTLRHGAFNFLGKPCQIEEVLWVLDLVAQDQAFARTLAPAWPAERVREALDLDHGNWTRWGPPLPGTEGGLPFPSEGNEESPLATAGPRTAPPLADGTVLLHLAWVAAEPPRPAEMIERVRRTEAALGDSERLIAVADERVFQTLDVAALWAILAKESVPPALPRNLGPQRREILRRLKDRELALESLVRDAGGPFVAARARLCIEHLVSAGLVLRRADRFRLTKAGEEVLALLDRAAALQGSLPPRRRLFSGGP